MCTRTSLNTILYYYYLSVPCRCTPKRHQTEKSLKINKQYFTGVLMVHLVAMCLLNNIIENLI